MAFPQPHHLDQEQISRLFAGLEQEEALSVVRIRYKNKQELRFPETMTAIELKALLLESLLEQHLPGGDLEVAFPTTGQILIGHHDGVFWLQSSV